MIQQAQSRLPKSITVVLLADRGFVHTELMTMLTTQLGWCYRIRIKSNSWIQKGNWCQPKSFHLNCGEAFCLHNVQIYEGEFYGTVHVIIARNNIKCECGNCHEEALYFECPGCLQTVGYCMGQDDDYFEYCTDCWWQLSHDLVTVVIQK